MKTYTVIYNKDGKTCRKYIFVGDHESIQSCLLFHEIPLDEVVYVFPGLLNSVKWNNQ